ncbi:MAG TPA: histidine kinase dimerization/phosphoacceptor domain -containing protein [Sphingomicrobium sp.]|jgi:two-component sensor histidine kinase|nr:histidine kinase dimerization/phosphoacceptor domain -containing protein [Sphingomicrobium sp.]
MTAAERFGRLPTAAKFLLILTAVLLPIGIALVWLGESGIQQANEALKGRAEDQSRAAAEGMESLLARDALALRIAANGALAEGTGGACERAQRSLTIAPGVAQGFELETGDAKPICAAGTVGDTGSLPLVAPGSVVLRIAPGLNGVAIRVGVIGGMATAFVPMDVIRTAALEAPGDVDAIVLHDNVRELTILAPPATGDKKLRFSEWSIGDGALQARIGAADRRITTFDRLVLLLPVLMWVAAALLTWLLVSRLLIRPLKRLERAVINYEPGVALDLPRKLGPSQEIQELRDAFGRAVARVEESDSEMTNALEGQRRLVREVHHRVKNNLQVVASLLNIHGRSASTPDARSAYAGISRRVGALSIVHRNHFAEMEENRGIAMRPLITELAAELRAGAPEAARTLRIDLELDSVNTTQDVAVAVAFLVTEIVEFAMLHSPSDPIEISLRRTSELTAQLLLTSKVLVPDDDATAEKVQFERIVAGLAKQLRSTLDRKLGRYGVDLPVFPPV